MGQIEAELQKIHAAASRLHGDVLPSNKPRAIAAPVANEPSTVEVVTQVDATDVTVKKPRKLKVKVKAKAKAKTKMARKAKSDGPLPANAASLLAHLTSVLNPDSFGKINQTSVATAINMAKGSVGASVRRLVDEGFLAQDPALGYKLTERKA
jgi:DNA-binding IclR family transcriptional regulator